MAAFYKNWNLCKELINKHNFNVYMTDNYGYASTHFASSMGSYKLVKFFLEKGTDILLKTECGLTCLHIAAYHGHLNLSKMLVNKHNFDVHMTDNKGSTAIHFSAARGSYELIKFFIDKGTNI